MGDNSKATVKIYGQEYTIAGSTTGEQIVLVANHVDGLMNQIAKAIPSMNTHSLAVLTAVNISNDYFEAKDRITVLESDIASLKNDAEHYVQLWEDAKASFKQYKEDAQNSIEQLQELQRIFNMKNVELNKAKEALEDVTLKYEETKAALEEAKAMLEEEKANSHNSQQAAIADADETLKKYKELENSFFDIQMENIQLKNELDNLRNKIKSEKR